MYLCRRLRQSLWTLRRRLYFRCERLPVNCWAVRTKQRRQTDTPQGEPFTGLVGALVRSTVIKVAIYWGSYAKFLDTATMSSRNSSGAPPCQLTTGARPPRLCTVAAHPGLHVARQL